MGRIAEMNKYGQKTYGLLGRSLRHSYSPQIHQSFGSYPYALFEREPEEVSEFIQEGTWAGINVTIPYKVTAMEFCDTVSESARRIGCVNTLVKDDQGCITGYNTDYDGFMYLVRRSGIRIEGVKVCVFGTGGASRTIRTVLNDLGASEVVVFGRHEGTPYDELPSHYDAKVLVNTTPVGTFPNCPDSIIDIEPFCVCGETVDGSHDGLDGVLDVVYNPHRTGLMLQAERLGVKHESGLAMLVGQGKAASELFQGKAIDDDCLDAVCDRLSLRMRNIVLIGMPGCGKSTIGKALARELRREFVDLDMVVSERAGKPIPQIFEEVGEKGFRELESQAAHDVCSRSGLVVATGGGVVTQEMNYDLLRQNSLVILIDRPIDLLPTKGRPLSKSKGVEQLASERGPLYRRFADVTITNSGVFSAAVQSILDLIEG